jgi:predicted DNA binding CopG/RHH family protein
MIRESQRKYNQDHIKRIPLDVQIKEHEAIKQKAEALGMPVNAYIKLLIRKDLEQ